VFEDDESSALAAELVAEQEAEEAQNAEEEAELDRQIMATASRALI
jgi:hypothetical protein